MFLRALLRISVFCRTAFCHHADGIGGASRRHHPRQCGAAADCGHRFLWRHRRRRADRSRDGGGDIRRSAAGPVYLSRLTAARSSKATVRSQHCRALGDWRIINTQALVQGRTQLVADGRLRVEFPVVGMCFAEQQMVGLVYFTVPDNWRRVAQYYLGRNL